MGVKLEQIGNSLYIQATLPPKPESKRTKPYQQRVTLGLYANSEGFRQAEAKAKEISGLLAQGRFSWQPYLKQADTEVKKTSLGSILEDFEKTYFQSREETLTTLQTLKTQYLTIFKQLPIDVPLSLEALKEVILTTAPNSRSRKRYVIACSKLAVFVGLDTTEIKALSGCYSIKHLSPRDLPSDQEIVRSRSQIIDPSWRWLFGVMATYGIRNHEAFHVDLEDYPLAFVNRGKTGERYCYPLYPEWADDWELEKVLKPKCTGRTNSDLGNRVTHAFKRFGVPYSPYNLRHAWAIRSLAFNLDITLAASMMGHSVQVHSQVYRHWLNKDIFQKAYYNLLNNPNRPLPPIL